MSAPLESRAQTATDNIERASSHLARGLEHYEAREFERAIAEFQAGYKLDPRPAFLFAQAQAERRSGDCASAMTYYERFLATNPPDAQVQAARMHLGRCRAALGSKPRDRKSGAKSDRKQVVLDLPPLAPRVSRWYHDIAGDVLLGSGAVSMVMGASFIAVSESARDRVAWAATYPEYDIEIARAQRYRMWGVVALATGTALAAGALYRFYSHSGREERLQNIGVTPMSGGMTLTYGSQF